MNKPIAPERVKSDKTWRARTALPQELLDYGLVPDFDVLHPGDLILLKASQPDFISKQIEKVQALGYGSEHAAWTHAAIYLGDELMLCEAQFDPERSEFGVIVTPFWNYFKEHEICVKRSKYATNKETGWAIATAAVTKIGNQYDYKFILKLIAERILFPKHMWLLDHTGKISANAFICSSLYSTAHAYATDVTISDKLNGLCVPAYLAMESRHLEPVEISWRQIS
jgi:Permuted papain-like amidase enzyme, YaeF/YiiX, C92 family